MKFKKIAFMILLTLTGFANIYGYKELTTNEISVEIAKRHHQDIKNLDKDKLTKFKSEIELFEKLQRNVHDWINLPEKKDVVENDLAELKQKQESIYSNYFIDHFTEQFKTIKDDDKKAIKAMNDDINHVIKRLSKFLKDLKDTHKPHP